MGPGSVLAGLACPGRRTYRFEFQTADTRPHSRDTTSPEFCVVPRERREQGMPDARCTRGLVCKVVQKVRTRAYRAAEAIRHSLRNGFTAYDAHPGVSGFLAPVASRKPALGPGRAFAPPKDLTPTIEASDPHDFAVRFSTARQHAPRPLTEFIPPCDPIARTMPPRPPHPIPTFGDDGQRPFLGDRMA